MIHALFFLLLLLSPTQLGQHWWPQWSLVSGVRVDYLSPTLYLTDIILVLLIGLTLWENRTNARYFLKRIFSFNSSLFIVYCLLFIVFSPRPLLSLYSLARYAQIPLVAWVSCRVCAHIGTARFCRLTGVGLSIGILWTVMLSAVQIIAGKTVGFWILGERTFTIATPGIATLSVFGRTILRPYATFPHPNALAGFLAICWLLLRNVQGSWRKFDQTVRILSGLGVLLTASRLAIASLAIASLVMVGSGRAISFLTFPPQSVEERVILARTAMKMIGDHPLFGIGPGQFLVKLPDYLPRGTWLLQPVHNIPLLLLSEFGIAGLALLTVLFWKFLTSSGFRSLLTTHYSLLFFLLLTSLGDHYWVTVQQNRILLGIVAGLLFTHSPISSAQRRGGANDPRPPKTL